MPRMTDRFQIIAGGTVCSSFKSLRSAWGRYFLDRRKYGNRVCIHDQVTKINIRPFPHVRRLPRTLQQYPGIK